MLNWQEKGMIFFSVYLWLNPWTLLHWPGTQPYLFCGGKGMILWFRGEKVACSVNELLLPTCFLISTLLLHLLFHVHSHIVCSHFTFGCVHEHNAAGGGRGRQHYNVFWDIQLSTFTSWGTWNGRLRKEYRRRKHVYFSSAIFRLQLSLSTFKNTWTGPKAVIQLNAWEGLLIYRRTKWNFLRKVVLIPSYVFSFGTVFFSGIFWYKYNTNTQIDKCPLPPKILSTFGFGLP